MPLMSRQTLFLLSLTLTILLVYLLAPILTPFMLGATLAYLANPAVKRLQRRRVPHVLSVVIIFVLIFGGLALLITLLVPMIQQQIALLTEQLPKIYNWLQEEIIPWLRETVDINTITSALSSGVLKSGSVVAVVVHSGAGIISVVVGIVLTPVVTFYFLRDWDDILARIQRLLPASIKPAVKKLAHECDEVLGAFFRGQLLIMLALCFIYSIGLAIAGLQLGIIIGLIGGVLSIVPYLGSCFVVVAASIASMVQFGTWEGLLGVLIAYLVGQIIESYVLAPYLIGSRIGLHPVAVIFAVMAGGKLFGFFGVLLALPVAAIIMVFMRYGVGRYMRKSARG
jgi:predicted PurR-regulated permease PerM